MFKKTMLAAAILAATSGIAVAGPKPYVGVSVGVATNTSSHAAGSQQYSRVAPYGLFAGYGGLITDDIYLGGEISGTIGAAKITEPGTNAMSTTFGYGLSVVPGLMLSKDTMVFARGGLVGTRFDDAGKIATGGIFGVGMQTAVSQNVDVRGEYDFTAYKSVRFISAPRSDAFTVGLVYKL